MKTVLINREDRPERLRDSVNHLSSFGLEPEVFPAILGGGRGCRDSHLAVLSKYRSEEHIFILEDDVLFLSDPIKVWHKIATQLPTDFDMLYFGISPNQPCRRISDNLFRVYGGLTTHAILWHNRQGGVVEYILKYGEIKNKWDVFLNNEVLPKFKCYVVYPLCATQRETGHSDTCKRSDVRSIIRNYNRFVK
jgi:hypothetical protein